MRTQLNAIRLLPDQLISQIAAGEVVELVAEDAVATDRSEVGDGQRGADGDRDARPGKP